MIFRAVELSRHSGANILFSTIKHALQDLIDTFFVIMLLLMGFGGFGYCLSGATAGSLDFVDFRTSMNTIARLAFGLYDYDQYMSEGYGQGYAGIGLGTGAILQSISLWLAFFMLSTVIVNILIAVISDGYGV